MQNCDRRLKFCLFYCVDQKTESERERGIERVRKGERVGEEVQGREGGRAGRGLHDMPLRHSVSTGDFKTQTCDDEKRIQAHKSLLWQLQFPVLCQEVHP